jgi:hypothetical protein
MRRRARNRAEIREFRELAAIEKELCARPKQEPYRNQLMCKTITFSTMRVDITLEHSECGWGFYDKNGNLVDSVKSFVGEEDEKILREMSVSTGRLRSGDTPRSLHGSISIGTTEPDWANSPDSGLVFTTTTEDPDPVP